MMDLMPYVENVRRDTAELKRRRAEATERARRDLCKITDIVRSDPHVKRAYLFGSLAKGMFHSQSDIDIAVEGLDDRSFDDLRERVQRVTEFRVDLRDLDAGPEFRRVVEFYGELLHADSCRPPCPEG